MKNSQQLLSSMVNTTRMGKIGLHAVLDTQLNPQLRTVVAQQHDAYGTLEKSAMDLAEQRGWDLRKPNKTLSNMIEHMTRMKLGKKDRTGRVANMLIQGNTQGMISSLRDMHQYAGSDKCVAALNQKLIDLEKKNISDMEPFL